MFDMQVQWWELILRGAIVYVVLLTMIRLSGKRTVGQFSPFDLLVVMLVSEAVSGSLNAGDESLQGGLILAAVLLGANFLIDIVTTHSQRVEKILEGQEVLIGRDGRIFHDVMKKNRLAQSAIDYALRQADITVEEVDYAILEADGTISILKKKSKS